MASGMKCYRHFNLHESEGAASAVYSLDLSPDGSLLATCGGDALVRLWSTGVVFGAACTTTTGNGGGAAAGGGTAGVPEAGLVGTLAKHTAVVTSVRWSTEGAYLASGSDDTFVFVWACDASTSNKWARVATLRGHSMDVLDVAWAVGDQRLASCSIDNKVMIWDTSTLQLMMAPFKVLEGHANWVKGVSWDPTGRFLASASEDRKVLVWRSGDDDWRVETEITKPFEGVSSQTFFQRVSWAPDGNSLGLPNAAKSLQETAAIVSRGTWATLADLVGHKHPVTVVKFCPALFEDDLAEPGGVNNSPKGGGGNGRGPRTVVAIGGQDATISVWTSACERPVVVFRDCFNGAVSDLSWSKDGALLVASSHDGSTCAFAFDVAADLGAGKGCEGGQLQRLRSRSVSTRFG